MRRLLTVLALLATVLISTLGTRPAQAAVWTATEKWTPAWEQKYRDWVSTSWDKEFFKRPGFYQDVQMDCADTVYSMRLIFAALNSLPFAIKDPSGGSGVISNDMTRWDSLAPDVRKRRFLTYVFEMGSTASLPDDTYPVAVSRDTITSGSLLLTDKLSHHSWTVKYVSQTGIPFLLFASRPARTVLFERFEFPSVEFTFPGGLKPERNAGFRAFRRPEDLKKPVWEVPGYSLEQYQIPVDSWIRTMQKRLQLQAETPEGHISRVLAEACKGAQERVDIIKQGVALNAQAGSRCLNAQEYDDFSTPNRDLRMKGTFEDLRAAYDEASRNSMIKDAALSAKVHSVLAGDASAANNQAFCTVEISPGVKLTLGQIYARSLGGKLSNNPHDTLEMRWGLQAFPSSKAKSCPVY